MTDTLTAIQSAETDVLARLKEQEEENELLLLQLHQVQEELERCFMKCRELEQRGNDSGGGITPVGGWVDDDLPALQAEVFRLTGLVKAQKWQREVESKNALDVRLGNILIQGVSSSGSIVGLPVKLLGIWRASRAAQPSAALGGESFDKVLQAFRAGGLEFVDQLLGAEPAPEMRAKAYTALARHQMKDDLFADAALSARRAYEEEPKPFRLKWLAFRLHDAGEIAEADAYLSLLPLGTTFSESEARQRDQVRAEAESARLREAKQKTCFEARWEAMERQIQALRSECDKNAKQVAGQEAEISSLQQALSCQQEGFAKQLCAHKAEVEALRQDLEKTEEERSGLKASIEDLTRLRDEESRLAADRLKRIYELQHKLQASQTAEAELATRQGMIREEMARAEAQLDLLKEIFLREQGV